MLTSTNDDTKSIEQAMKDQPLLGKMTPDVTPGTLYVTRGSDVVQCDRSHTSAQVIMKCSNGDEYAVYRSSHNKGKALFRSEKYRTFDLVFELSPAMYPVLYAEAETPTRSQVYRHLIDMMNGVLQPYGGRRPSQISDQFARSAVKLTLQYMHSIPQIRAVRPANSPMYIGRGHSITRNKILRGEKNNASDFTTDYVSKRISQKITEKNKEKKNSPEKIEMKADVIPEPKPVEVVKSSPEPKVEDKDTATVRRSRSAFLATQVATVIDHELKGIPVSIWALSSGRIKLLVGAPTGGLKMDLNSIPPMTKKNLGTLLRELKDVYDVMGDG